MSYRRGSFGSHASSPVEPALVRRTWLRTQQRERVHGLGMVVCHLDGDGRAARVARDVGAPQTELVEQRRGVGGVVGDADRRRGVRLPSQPRLW